MSKHTALCPAPGCTKVGDFARNFCSKHYLEFRKDCKANGSWYTSAPLPSPIVIVRFQWEGDEESLAEMCEEQEKLRIERQKRKQQPVAEEKNHE